MKTCVHTCVQWKLLRERRTNERTNRGLPAIQTYLKGVASLPTKFVLFPHSSKRQRTRESDDAMQRDYKFLNSLIRLLFFPIFTIVWPRRSRTRNLGFRRVGHTAAGGASGTSQPADPTDPTTINLVQWKANTPYY